MGKDPVPHRHTLGDVIARNARLFPDKPAIVFEDEVISHCKFADRVYRLANALLTRGAKRSSRIAILSQNCPEYLEVFGPTRSAA